jgi:hypothetical protein
VAASTASTTLSVPAPRLSQHHSQQYDQITYSPGQDHTPSPPTPQNPARNPQDVADSCRTGPATDIIFGLALGYKSTIIPCFVIAICIYIGNT